MKWFEFGGLTGHKIWTDTTCAYGLSNINNNHTRLFLLLLNYIVCVRYYIYRYVNTVT